MRIGSYIRRTPYRPIYARKLHRVREEFQETKGIINRSISLWFVLLPTRFLQVVRDGVIDLLRLTCSYQPMINLSLAYVCCLLEQRKVSGIFITNQHRLGHSHPITCLYRWCAGADSRLPKVDGLLHFINTHDLEQREKK
jgi:hypothetical protein